MFPIITIIALIASIAIALFLKSRKTPTQAKMSCDCPVERLSCLAVVVGLAGAAVTGLGAAVLLGGLHHWPLMLHCAIAPLFAVGVAALAVLWGERHMPDRPFMPGRALFWIMLAAALVVILSAVIPMTPLFGTDGQHLLLDIHRYSALIVTCVTILYIGRRASAVKTASTGECAENSKESTAVQHV